MSHKHAAGFVGRPGFKEMTRAEAPITKETQSQDDRTEASVSNLASCRTLPTDNGQLITDHFSCHPDCFIRLCSICVLFQ